MNGGDEAEVGAEITTETARGTEDVVDTMTTGGLKMTIEEVIGGTGPGPATDTDPGPKTAIDEEGLDERITARMVVQEARSLPLSTIISQP